MKKSAERRSIMDKFPNIEKLAAYFDGNLPQDEMLQISKMAEERYISRDTEEIFSRT